MVSYLRYSTVTLRGDELGKRGSALDDGEDEILPETANSHDLIADKAISEISASELGVPQIPYHLVEKHQNKTTKLLSNSGDDIAIQAKNRWHDYEFAMPLFIGFVDIVGTELSVSDEYVFKVKLEGGAKREFHGKPNGNAIRVDINEFCKSISFKPPSVFWSLFMRNPELQKVSIYGFYKESLGEFLYKISRTTAIKNAAINEIEALRKSTSDAIEELTTKESHLRDIENLIADAQIRTETLNSSISEKAAQDFELQSKIDRSDENLNSIKSLIAERNEELATVTRQRESEKAEVDVAKSELKKLKEDINLFPSEISGFAAQASQDVKLYTLFISSMILVVVSLFIWVLTGAFDLSEYVKDHPEVNVWSLLLAKVPLAMVVSAIVTAAYKISKVFIEELLKINRQKLSLTQVSIIAKDVSHAAESDLELSETDIYGLRLRTKMAMLADHIKTFIPTDPVELLPQSIFSAFSKSRRDPVNERQALEETRADSDDTENAEPQN